jgi:hypothetical protein
MIWVHRHDAGVVLMLAFRDAVAANAIGEIFLARAQRGQ